MEIITYRRAGLSVIFLKVTLIASLILLPNLLQSTPTEEQLAKDQQYLEAHLIAPCCFRQVLADHESEPSGDMKKQIAELLRSGKTVKQIEDYYIAEYGDRILAVPRMKGFNMMSFLMPIFAFAIGIAIMLLTLRRWINNKTPEKIAIYTPSNSKDMDERIEKDLENY